MKYKITNQWIIGFVDGEGCFHIGITKSKTMKLGYQIIPEFTIVQHKRDLALLYAIKHYFNCGIVQSNRGKKEEKFNTTHAPRWCYRVRKTQDLLNIIIPFFEENPLLTTKHKDFLLFKTAMNLIKQKNHLTSKGIEEIRQIKNLMNRNRIE